METYFVILAQWQVSGSSQSPAGRGASSREVRVRPVSVILIIGSGLSGSRVFLYDSFLIVQNSAAMRTSDDAAVFLDIYEDLGRDAHIAA